MDRHALSWIESGQTMPSFYTIFKIAKTLQVPPASLLPDVN
ncbi:MAG: helix-turn-helix domain-containing protein [Bacteroidota bacterium]|nr:helix-turn-helix transcriptional regulator [Cytophagales bacterium]